MEEMIKYIARNDKNADIVNGELVMIITETDANGNVSYHKYTPCLETIEKLYFYMKSEKEKN